MTSALNIKLLSNEIIIDSWDVYYTFTNDQCFFGLLTVTNKRIFFNTKIDGAVEKMLNISSLLTNHVPNHVILSKNHIKLIETLKDSSGNKAVMNMDNGEKHVLDRKMLAIDKIIEALNIL